MSRHFWKSADCAPPLENPEHHARRDIFGGGSSNTSTVVQNSDPWGPSQPYLTDLFSRAQTLADQGPYQGPYLAGQSPYSQMATQRLVNAGTAAPDPLYDQASGQLTGTIRGDYLSPSSNPFLAGTVQQALDQVKRNVSGQFSGDNYGSSANQEWLARNLASTALPYYAQNYQNERARQLAATQLAPGMAAARTGQEAQKIAQLQAAGGLQEGRNQAEIQAAMQQYYAPWDNFFNYQRGITGAYAGGGTSSTTSPYYTNPAANLLGFGLGGLSLYNGLNSAGLLGASAALPAIGYGTIGSLAGSSMIPTLAGGFVGAI